MPFAHRFGACASVNNKLIYLCFSSMDSGGCYPTNSCKTCRVAHSPTGKYDLIAKSQYSHSATKTAISKNVMLTVGGCWVGLGKKIGHTKTELLDTKTNTWTTLQDYRFDLGI